MVGVQVEAVGIKGRHDGRADAPNQRHQRPADLVWRCVRQLAVAIVQQVQLVEADDACGLLQFLFTACAGIFLTAQGRVARLARSPLVAVTSTV